MLLIRQDWLSPGQAGSSQSPIAVSDLSHSNPPLDGDVLVFFLVLVTVQTYASHSTVKKSGYRVISS